jgi:hypothetical protein
VISKGKKSMADCIDPADMRGSQRLAAWLRADKFRYHARHARLMAEDLPMRRELLLEVADVFDRMAVEADATAGTA